jgi:hypothetical protein
MEYECARYNKMAAQESLTGVTAILNNNLGAEIEWAIPIYEISKLDVEKYKQEVENLIDLGAVPTDEGYQPPVEAEGFTTDVFKDPIIITDKAVIDYVPLSDSGAATPISQ